MKNCKKKLLSLMAVMGIVFGFILSPLTQVTAKAELFKLNEDTTLIPIQNTYTQGVRFKLRARANSLYKAWWNVELTVSDEGQLIMTGPTNIPSNLTFDDEFIIHVFDRNTRIAKLIYRTQYQKQNAPQMDELMDAFNRANVGVGDYITIIGRGWDGTVRFASSPNAIIQTTDNDYTNGYRSINKYDMAFRVTDEGLKEVPYCWALLTFYFVTPF